MMGRLWGMLAVGAGAGLVAQTGEFSPVPGLLALLIVALFLAALAAILKRK